MTNETDRERAAIVASKHLHDLLGERSSIALSCEIIDAYLSALPPDTRIADLETRLKEEKERSAYYTEATNSACERLEIIVGGSDSKIASYSVEPQIRRLNDQITALQSQLAEAHRIIEGKLKYLSIEEANECPGPLDCSLSYTVMIEDKKRLEALVLALKSQVARMMAALEELAGVGGSFNTDCDSRRLALQTLAALGPDPKGEKETRK